MARSILQNVSWISGAFVAHQVIRLGSHVILATIISPSVFGIMLILNTLRTGVEQITDVGIGQNIIFDKMGYRARFYNTAWTIQIIRGFILFALFLLASPFLASAFGEADLEYLLPLFGVIFVISGFATPSIFLMQKKLEVSRQLAVETVGILSGTILTLGFALISPTAEALVWALLVNAVIVIVVAAGFMNWRNLRLRIDRSLAKRILTFGQWIFVASLFHFAASSFDRLYFAAVLPITLLGVFGVARTFSEAAYLLAQRFSTRIVFPMVVESHRAGDGIGVIASARAVGLCVAGILFGCGLAISDLAVDVLYDERYSSARFMLPILLLGAWFSIFSIVNESIVYGSGRPAINSGANVFKFLWLILTVPAAFSQSGFVAALIFIGLADLPRYLYLTLGHAGYRRKFILQDSIATILLICSAALVRLLIVEIGWVGSFFPPVPVELAAI